MVTTLTPEQEADARTRDVMAFAYRDTDGKLYTVNQSGQRVEAPAGTPALSAQYQKIAERTAALVITYDKILNLTPQERGILADLASGKRQVDETITGGLRDAWNGLKSASQDSGVLPNIPGAGLISGAAGLASGTASGVGLVPTFLSDVRQLISNLGDQVGGGGISRENAIAIGTAYASARQVAASGRPLEPGVGDYFKGLFSSHFLSYAGAGLAWLLDMAAGFAENIPGIGDWIKQQGWAKHQTLAQHIETAMRDDDNVEVASEISELDRLGGRDAKETATLLTTGGTVRDGAGNATPVNPADSASEAPTGPGGADAPTTPDAALAAAQQNNKSFLSRAGTIISEGFNNTAQVMGAAGPVGAVVGTTIFGVGAYRAGAGFAGGIAHRQAVKPAVDLYKEYTAAQAAIPALKNRVEHAKAGTRASWLSLGVEDKAEAKANLAEAKARVTTLQADLAEMGVDVESKAFRKLPAAERLASVAEQRYAHLAIGTAAEQRAAWLASNVDKARNPFNPMHWPGMWGRGAGYATVATVDTGTSVIGGITSRVGNWVSGMTNHVRGWWGGGHNAATATADAALDAAPAPAAVADTGKAAHAIAAAEEVAETAAHAAPAAARSAGLAGMLGRLGTRLSSVGAGRFSGVFKILGVTAIGASAVIPVQAMANTGEAIAKGDKAEARVRGAETATYGAIGATAIGAAPTALGVAKIGLGRVAAGVAPVMETADLASGLAHHDQRKVQHAAVNLATISAFTAGGAALGLAGGPFAAISVPAGAMGGLFVGGLVTAGRNLYQMFSGEDSSPQVAAAPAQAPRPAAPAQQVQVAMTPEEVMRGQDIVRDQVRMAIMRGGSAQGGFNPNAFASIRSTSMGAVNPQGNPAGSTARPQGAAVNV
jgi:hypothetical protein